ncbi:MAG: GC-type dockerin domain-anchored protein [Phycisphaerales bacterium]
MLPEVLSVVEFDHDQYDIDYILEVDSADHLVVYSTGFYDSFSLHFWDLSDPTSPLNLATLDVPIGDYDFPSELALGDQVLAVSADGQVHIVDTSIPTSPVLASQLPIDADALAMEGDVLFVGSGQQVTVYDLSSPAAPTIVSTLNLSSAVVELDVLNNVLMVGTDGLVVDVYDASIPASITLKSSVSVDGMPTSIAGVVDAQSGEMTMHVSDTTPSLRSFNINDLGMPVDLGVASYLGSGLKRGASDELLSLFGSAVRVGTVSNQAPATQRSLLFTHLIQPNAHVTSLGTNTYLVCGPQHFSVLRPSEEPGVAPSSWTNVPLGLNSSDDLLSIAVQGSVVYAANDSDGTLSSIDVSDPSEPFVLDTIKTGFRADLELYNGVLYTIASSAKGAIVMAIDISDPSAMTPLNSWYPQFSEAARGAGQSLFLEVDGHHLLICAGTDLAIYDISDSLNPVFVSALSGVADDDGATEFHASDGIAATYSSYFHGGGEFGQIITVDYSDFANPFVIDIGGASDVRDLKVFGTTVFAVTRTCCDISTTQLLSMSVDDLDFFNPMQEFDFSTESYELGSSRLGPLVIDGDSMYTVSGALAVFDVADPTAIEYSGAMHSGLGVFPVSIVRDGDILYAIDGSSGRLSMSIIPGICLVGDTCPADLTGDGALDFFDVSAFLSAYNAQDPIADYNGDGMLNFFDVSAFLSAYNAGCP